MNDEFFLEGNVILMCVMEGFPECEMNVILIHNVCVPNTR